MHPQMSGTAAGNYNLAPAELLVAQDANSFVIERPPLPEVVCRPQNQQAIV
jgi:hypothetical protein